MLTLETTQRLPRGGHIATEPLTTIGEPNMSRRNALTQLAALPLIVAAGASVAAETKLPLRIYDEECVGV